MGMPDRKQLRQLLYTAQKKLVYGKSVGVSGDILSDGMEFLSKNSILPKKGEIAAVTITKPKTSALCYERVWDPTGQIVPESIRCSGRSAAEASMLMAMINENVTSDWESVFPSIVERWSSVHPEAVECLGGRTCYVNGLSKAFSDSTDCQAIPIYDSSQQQQKEYKSGDRQAIVTALENLSIVDESQLTWDQIRQFREDSEARKKYRRLMHWMDKDMVGKSQSFVEDEIAIKLEDYEQALKTHGIRTVLGTFSDILDGKFLLGSAGIGASFVLAGHPTLGLLAEAGLLINKVLVKLRQDKLNLDDVKRGDNSEIAAIYEIKKLDAGPDA